LQFGDHVHTNVTERQTFGNTINDIP